MPIIHHDAALNAFFMWEKLKAWHSCLSVSIKKNAEKTHRKARAKKIHERAHSDTRTCKPTRGQCPPPERPHGLFIDLWERQGELTAERRQNVSSACVGVCARTEKQKTGRTPSNALPTMLLDPKGSATQS